MSLFMIFHFAMSNLNVYTSLFAYLDFTSTDAYSQVIIYTLSCSIKFIIFFPIAFGLWFLIVTSIYGLKTFVVSGYSARN